jgi:hypothetical protein
VLAIGETSRLGPSVQAGFVILEIDALHGLRHVQRAGLPIETQAIPIKNAVRRIAVLLDFENEGARAERVNAPTSHQQAVARLRM